MPSTPPGTVAFIRGVFYVTGTTVTELSRLNEGNRAGLQSSSGSQPASHYSVMIDPTNGPVLELLPLPSSGTYRVDYILEHPGFAADGTPWYGPGRSDELIVLRTAGKAMRKEGNDSGAAQVDREYDYLLAKVQNQASWFDMRNAPRIRDAGPDIFGGGVRDPFDYDV